MHGKRSFAVLAAMIVALLASSGIAAAAAFSPGADGLGDPMFPQAGNGGYDVQHYALTLDYTPSGNQLTGTVVITARATQNCRDSISTSGGRSKGSRRCWSTASPRHSRATVSRSS